MVKIDEVRWIIRINDVMRNAVETLQCIKMDEEEASLQAQTLMGYCNALEDIATLFTEKRTGKILYAWWKSGESGSYMTAIKP